MRIKNNKWWRIYGWLVFAVVGVVLSAIVYISVSARIAEQIVILICLIGVIPEVVMIARDVWHKKFGVDILAVVAILASLVLQQYAAAAVILLMFTGGNALEQFASSRAQKELNNLLKRAPKIAHIKRGREFLDKPITQAQVHDIVLVKPGEVVPVDGTIIKGESSFDESAITGESMPQYKKRHASVLSGSINQDMAVEMRVLRTSGDSQYEQIIALVQAAASSKSPMVRMADAYSVPFTLLAFGLAALAWVVSGDPINALAVLVVATPCPLLIATPVAIVSGMSRAAHNGVIVKDGASLEALSRVRVLAFDKTGTLTSNEPKIVGISSTKLTHQQLLVLVASVEQDSTHVLARTIVKTARAKRLKLYKVERVSEQSGGGVIAHIDGQEVIIGKQVFLEHHGIHVPVADQDDKHTILYVARNHTYLGSIRFADTIRANARATLTALKAMGIRQILMLTGDKKQVAEHIAQSSGITEVYAELLPIQKLHQVQSYKQKHMMIGMVGDGVNDAPTLAAADIGIALGAKGSTAASESADVVIMLDDIGKVASAFSIAKRSIVIAKQSIWVGIGLSIVLMIFASLGKIVPVYGALLQELVDVAVILNALRALSGSIVKRGTR